MGLTSGICDVGGLYECLAGINKGIAYDSILDKYCEKRREKYLTVVDPISSANFKRLWEKTPEETVKTDEFLSMLEKGEENPLLAQELTKVKCKPCVHEYIPSKLIPSRVCWLCATTSHNTTRPGNTVSFRYENTF